MKILDLEIDRINPAPYNPRVDLQPGDHDYDRLKASIETFGLVEPLVFNERTGNLVGGHQRLKVLKGLGHKQVSVVAVNLNDDEERAMNAALNRIQGQWDFSKLSAMLKEINVDALKLTGFTDDELKNLLSRFDPAHALTDPDHVPDAAPTVCKPGDLWELGPHRLYCGDATKHESFECLMDGNRATMIFTDPPWNVAIGKNQGPERAREEIANDDLGADFPAFLQNWASACLPYLDGDLYCVMGSREWPAIDQTLRDAGMHWSSALVWVKDAFVMGRRNYHGRFEPIWYGWREDKKSSYSGDRSQDDVWEVPRPKVSKEHPTMKPVDLVAKAIRNSSKPGDIVLEPFGGSGSTLIACERDGRRCFTMELDPKYCDVIIERYRQHTGKASRLVGQPEAVAV